MKNELTDYDPLSDFQEGQWWIKELDAFRSSGSATDEQKRAVSVVHNLLRAVAAEFSALHKRAERLDRMAATETAESFMALPDADKRWWFATYVDASSRRKKALLALEQYEHEASHVGRERCVIEAVAHLSGTALDN